MLHSVDFKLVNETIKFTGVEYPIEKIVSCDDVLIIFASLLGEIVLYKNFAFNGINGFEFLLNKVINNQAHLHPTVQLDIGYLWNQELDGEVELMAENGFWVGQKNLLWSSTCGINQTYSSWLYNNDASEIVLEVTPTYKWHFQDPEPGDKYISYDDFMKNYKPILFRVIPKIIAKRWLKQVQALLKKIKNNEQKESSCT